MKIIRFVLGSFLLLCEKIFSPKSMIRTPEAQLNIDGQTKMLALYQFKACPFCIKVRMAIKKLGLKIDCRDIQNNKTFEDELIKGGGQRQVPCLKIKNPDGSTRWLYESSDIIKFLQQTFAS